MDRALEDRLRLGQPIPDVFDVDDDCANDRFSTFSAVDPFPDIPAALLNTADLLDYVAATAMIHPFHIDMAQHDETLKPATYGVPILGEYVYWTLAGSEEAGTPVQVTGVLSTGQRFKLPRNTIAYVTLEPVFRLPNYIAARFNLNIRDIYRGILVGTGPLVDPGFEGPLSVPLHNLTANDYELVGGEPLVWMEFTKLSRCDAWREAGSAEQPERKGFYVAFPERKKDTKFPNVHAYLKKASGDRPIVSSIPDIIGRAQAAAESARLDATAASRNARRSRRTIQAIGLGATLGVTLALAAILLSAWSLVNDVGDRSDDLADRVTRIEAEPPPRPTTAALEREIGTLRARVQRLERQSRQP